MFNNALQPTTTPSIVPTPSPVYPLAPGRYRIRNLYSGTYMRPYNGGTADNMPVVVYPLNTSYLSQQFDLEQTGDGAYYIKNASGKYLMNYKTYTADNTDIVIYPLNGYRENNGRTPCWYPNGAA